MPEALLEGSPAGRVPRLSLLYGTLPVSVSVCLGLSLLPLSKFGVLLIVSHLSGTLLLRPASTGNF